MVEKNLCSDCSNAVRWEEETFGDIYSYQRNGTKWDKKAKCSQTGEIIDLHIIKRCSHHAVQNVLSKGYRLSLSGKKKEKKPT